MINVKLPKKAIINSKTALEIQGCLNFSDNKIHIMLPRSSNISKIISANKLFSAKKQADSQINIGVEKKDNILLYSKERLILKLHKFSLTHEQYEYAFKSLSVSIDLSNLEKLKKQLKSTNDDDRINQLLNKKTNIIKYILLNSHIPRKKDRFIRAYIASRINKIDNAFILKGGTIFDLMFPKSNRATKDIDGYIQTGEFALNKVIKELTTKKDNIKIIVNEIKNKEKQSSLKIELSYIVGDEVITDVVDIDLNKSFDLNEILNIKKTYNIISHYEEGIEFPIDYLSLEQLLVEKTDQLIWWNGNATRTKDLIDIVSLYTKYSFDNLNKEHLKKWFKVKNEKSSRKKRNNTYKDRLKELKINISEKIEKDWNSNIKSFDLDPDKYKINEAYIILKLLINILKETLT